jgi:hypothetical protein
MFSRIVIHSAKIVLRYVTPIVTLHIELTIFHRIILPNYWLLSTRYISVTLYIEVFYISFFPILITSSLVTILGINARFIGLSSRDSTAQSKTVKLGRVGYYIRLLDLHRSNPFGIIPTSSTEESQIPEGW